jgi:transcriptional regulator GlxA family with amidase domain
MRNQVHVSLVVFPECDPSIVYGVFDTLWAAGRDFSDKEDTPIFIPRIVSSSRKVLELVTGVSIVPQDGIDDVDRTDVVFVPNVLVKSAACLRGLDRGLLDWIKAMHGQGAALYSACGGSLVLAEAGLLEGEAATTHWSYAALFKEQYPDVTLHADRLIVQSGDGHSIVCSGGASSWQDLALLLVAKFAGTAEAVRLSKLFLYQWHRDGQLPYASMLQNVKHGDAELRQSGCRGRPGSTMWAAEANLRQAVQDGDRLFPAGLYPGLAGRGGQAIAGNHRHRRRGHRPRGRLRRCGVLPPAFQAAGRYRPRGVPAEIAAAEDDQGNRPPRARPGIIDILELFDSD